MSKTLKASLLLGLAGVLYGVMMTTMQIANDNGYTRADVMACQFLLSATVFFIIILIKYRDVHLKGKQRLRLMLIGVFGYGTNFCMYETLYLTSSSFAVTMLFQYVWMGIAFDALVTKKLPPWYTVFAVALVFIGTPLATGFFDTENTLSVPSVLWGFGAAAFYTGMLWTSARLETQVPSVVRTFYFSFTQATLSIVAAPHTFFISVADPTVWMYAIPLALTTAIIPATIIMRNAPKVPVSITTIMTGMELPSTIILGAIVLQFTYSPLVVAGIVLICAGIVMANKEGIVELRKPKLKSDEDTERI